MLRGQSELQLSAGLRHHSAHHLPADRIVLHGRRIRRRVPVRPPEPRGAACQPPADAAAAAHGPRRQPTAADQRQRRDADDPHRHLQQRLPGAERLRAGQPLVRVHQPRLLDAQGDGFRQQHLPAEHGGVHAQDLHVVRGRIGLLRLDLGAQDAQHLAEVGPPLAAPQTGAASFPAARPAQTAARPSPGQQAAQQTRQERQQKRQRDGRLTTVTHRKLLLFSLGSSSSGCACNPTI